MYKDSSISNNNTNTETFIKKKVAIIGAGISGLTAARRLDIENISYQVFEINSTVGNVWSKPYHNMKAQTPYYFVDFPDKEDLFTEKYGKLFVPDANGYYNYLYDYSVENKLIEKILFNTKVTKAIQDKNTLRWTVTYVTRDEIEKEDQFDYLIVSGTYFDPFVPQFKNNGFKGKIIHVTDFIDVNIASNNKVVILGNGKSSYDVAASLVKENKCSVPPVMLFRKFRWVFPTIYPSIKYGLFYMLTYPEYYYKNDFEKWFFNSKIVKFFRKIFNKGLEMCIERDYHLKELGLKSQHSLAHDWSYLRCLMPTYVFDEAVKGNMLFKQGEIDFLEDNYIILKNGDKIEADLIICGTGYKNFNYTFFDDENQKILKRDNDGIYLFRDIIHPEIPNCAFLGRLMSGASTWAYQATWISYLIKGEIQFSKDYMNEQLEILKKWKRETYTEFSAVRSIFTSAHMRYVELLLNDMGFNVESTVMDDIGPFSPASFDKFRKYYACSSEQMRLKKD